MHGNETTHFCMTSVTKKNSKGKKMYLETKENGSTL